MKRLVLLLFLMKSFWAFGTHGRAGEITYRCLPPASAFKYEITVTTYTKTESCAADKCSLTVDFGDNSSALVYRINGAPCPVSPYCNESACANCGEVLPNNPAVKKNVYRTIHSYPGQGQYIISMEDPNRNDNIVNIPNSATVPFFIESKLIISAFYGCNSSPALNYPPIDNGCVGEIFEHNPGAVDPDNDSLAYSIVECLGANGQPIPGYTFPNVAPDCVGGTLSIDPNTGTVIWASPVCQGEFNLCILIEEYRKGYLIGTVRRDMQIIIGNCNNNRPVIEDLNQICVIAGDVIDVTVTANDANGDMITLTGTGEPLSLTNNPAIFTQPVSNSGTVSSDFYWQTACSHIRKQLYYMIFRAEDDNTEVNLVDYETLEIKIIGPAPENPAAAPSGNAINLTWDASICSNAKGYKVYRRLGASGWVPAYCETGVPAYTGFTKIATITGINNTTLTDDNNEAGLIHGQQYCYRVIAYFEDGAESRASEEFCAELKKDVPVITHVTVENTGVPDGSIKVIWAKPTEMNDTVYPGPYHYKVYRTRNYDYPDTYIGSTTINNLLDSTDTLMVDSPINTLDYQYNYRVELFSGSTIAGSTHNASSVYLSSNPSDNILQLTWQENVPWTNEEYTIYREMPTGSGIFNPIAAVTGKWFTDTGLVNGRTYCYYVRSKGGYSASGFVNPIFNNSQVHCGIPVDTIPPCPPPNPVINRDCDLVENTLTWDNPNNSCSDDVIGYHIYYAPLLGQALQLIDTTIRSPEITTFLHNTLNGEKIESVAGCYAITAIDSFYNESALSEIVCTDNCPNYHLPNVFTPGGDGINDYFMPFPYKFVKSIDLEIFNRWGQLVFETTDPNILWNGRHLQSGKPCNAGVYYYVCEVHEIRLTGIKTRVIKGQVQILYEKNPTLAK